MADLLLELFSEEIPARMQGNAIELLQNFLERKLSELHLLTEENIDSSHYYVTPRRLAVWLKDLPEKTADIATELKGPRVDAPEQAVQGFLKKSGLTLEQLEKRDGVYVANIHQKGKPTAEILKTIIEEILAKFPWPKSMRWGTREIAWVRPLHNILCIFDGKVVPVEFGGVKANNKTFGHRFLAPQAIEITKAEDYEKLLEKAFVIADTDKRRALISQEAASAAAALGLTVKQDDGLLNEVTGLVEWPVILTGRIDAKYMDLPPEVLISEMRAHQKYFALLEMHAVEIRGGKDIEKGRVPHVHATTAQHLVAHFLIVSNMAANDKGKAIVAGNERVLRARLADGEFFWQQDRKKKLDDWAKGLKDVTFHARLGTVADKVERVKIHAARIADYVKGADQDLVTRAATLCKADLVTGMVGEFPELQGVMGRYYALAQGENEIVANAVRDHYLPLGPATPCPTAPESVCIALADKLDTLIGMFNVGEKPTGSKDPFALRRAALGVIRIILENDVRLPLRQILPSSRGAHSGSTGSHAAKDPAQSLRDSQDDAKGLLEFFSERLQVSLKDQGIRHDVVKAVMATGDDDLVRVVARAKALQEFLGTEDGKNLLAGYKRAANILAIEEKKDKTTYNKEVNFSLLSESAEKELFNALNNTQSKIDTMRREEKFIEAMELLATLRAPVDHFFDKIMVNSDNKELRINRLRLLACIRYSMDSIANFALIEG